MNVVAVEIFVFRNNMGNVWSSKPVGCLIVKVSSSKDWNDSTGDNEDC